MTILGGLVLAAGALTPTQWTIAHSATTGPGSYAGHEWLVAVNLGFSTALFLVSLLFASQLVGFLWKNRRYDRWNHPVTCFRVILLLLAMGIAVRKGGAAAVLWKWNPADPIGTSTALTVQRFLDPVADVLQFAALALTMVAIRSLIAQLRRSGWDVPIWQSLPMLKRPLGLTIMSFVAAAGVVLTR